MIGKQDERNRVRVSIALLPGCSLKWHCIYKQLIISSAVNDHERDELKVLLTKASLRQKRGHSSISEITHGEIFYSGLRLRVARWKFWVFRFFILETTDLFTR